VQQLTNVLLTFSQHLLPLLMLCSDEVETIQISRFGYLCLIIDSNFQKLQDGLLAVLFAF
jgi:hypothetical protein